MTSRNLADTAERRIRAVGLLCMTAVVVGFTLLGVGLATAWGTEHGASLFAPGAGVLASGLAGLVATTSVVTWSQQRGRDSAASEYRHREEAYGRIVEQMTKLFTNSPFDAAQEAETRAKAALWADATTIRALAQWRAVLIPVREQQGGNLGTLQEPVLTAYYDVVVAMRGELSAKHGDPGSSLIDRESLLGSIFDNRPPVSQIDNTGQQGRREGT